MMTVTLHVHTAWWVWPYLNTLAFMSTLTGLEPDMDRVNRLIEKGVTLKAKPAGINQLTRNEHGNQ